MFVYPRLLLFLAVAIMAGVFSFSSRASTVPVEISDGRGGAGWCSQNRTTSPSPATTRTGSASECGDWRGSSCTQGTWQTISGWESSSYGNWLKADFKCNQTYAWTDTMWFLPDEVGGEVCPESHPINNGDGTCSEESTEDDDYCSAWADKNGSPVYSGGAPTGQTFDLSISGAYKPNKNGEICVPMHKGLDPDHPEQTFCAHTLSGEGVALGDGTISGNYVPSPSSCNPAPDSSEPPLDEPETPEECEKRGLAICASDGLFFVSGDVIDGFCIPVCSDQPPAPDAPPMSEVDDDADGVPNVNDPTHPDYDPDDPHSDKDGDGNPNYKDPNHTTYIGGGATLANTEGTNQLLQQILDSQTVNNDLTVTTNQLIAQQTQALSKRLDDLRPTGVGGVIGGDGDGSWGDETGDVDVDFDDCTPDPVTGACAEFGSLGVAALPESIIDVSSFKDDFTPIDAAGSCPSEMPLTMGFGNFSLNTAPLCDVLSGIYFLVMFSAYYSVARIITRGATS